MAREQFASENIAYSKSMERELKEARPTQLFKISHERNADKDMLE